MTNKYEHWTPEEREAVRQLQYYVRKGCYTDSTERDIRALPECPPEPDPADDIVAEICAQEAEADGQFTMAANYRLGTRRNGPWFKSALAAYIAGREAGKGGSS